MNRSTKLLIVIALFLLATSAYARGGYLTASIFSSSPDPVAQFEIDLERARTEYLADMDRLLLEYQPSVSQPQPLELDLLAEQLLARYEQYLQTDLAELNTQFRQDRSTIVLQSDYHTSTSQVEAALAAEQQRAWRALLATLDIQSEESKVINQIAYLDQMMASLDRWRQTLIPIRQATHTLITSTRNVTELP